MERGFLRLAYDIGQLRPAGGWGFSFRMEAKDGSFGFDFAGVYTQVVPHQLIEYHFGDRTACVHFCQEQDRVIVRIDFEPEETNPIEMQRSGWQAILDNFRRHVEARDGTSGNSSPT